MAKVRVLLVGTWFIDVFVQLKRNLQSLIAEHNIDVSKLQSTTNEHADTTNTFALMHKEMEQLRTEKYVNHK